MFGTFDFYKKEGTNGAIVVATTVGSDPKGDRMLAFWNFLEQEEYAVAMLEGKRAWENEGNTKWPYIRAGGAARPASQGYVCAQNRGAGAEVIRLVDMSGYGTILGFHPRKGQGRKLRGIQALRESGGTRQSRDVAPRWGICGSQRASGDLSTLWTRILTAAP